MKLYVSLLLSVFFLGGLPAATQAPLSVTFSYSITILCILFFHTAFIQRLKEGIVGEGGQGDFTVSQRTMPLLMHLSALCFINKDQLAGGRQKEDEMEGEEWGGGDGEWDKDDRA